MKALTTLPRHTFNQAALHRTDKKELIAIGSWVLTLLLMAAAYVYGIQVIGSVLEKLYQTFIQNNLLGF